MIAIGRATGGIDVHAGKGIKGKLLDRMLILDRLLRLLFGQRQHRFMLIGGMGNELVCELGQMHHAMQQIGAPVHVYVITTELEAGAASGLQVATGVEGQIADHSLVRGTAGVTRISVMSATETDC